MTHDATITYEFDVPADYTFDANKIVVDDGGDSLAKLKLEATAGVQVQETFDNPGDVTHQDSNKSEVAGGELKLIDQIDPNLYARYKLNTAAAPDDSGNNRNGVATGTTIVPGKINNAHSFNGTTARIAIGSTTDFNFSSVQSFSVFAWINTTENTNSITIISRQENPGGNGTGWNMYLRLGSSFSVLLNENASSRLFVENTTVPINDGSWHFVGFTYNGSGDAGGIILYIDGVSVPVTVVENSLTGDFTIAGIQATIGGRNDQPNDLNWDGQIDQTYVYDDIVTLSEVTTLYNSGNGREVEYPTDDPYVDLTVAEVDETDEVSLTITDLTESVTKPVNTDIQYVVTTDTFTTTQYWNGVAWVVSDNSWAQSNDLATLLANIGSLDTSSLKFGIRAILRSTDGIDTPSLQTFTVTYSHSDYPEDDPTITPSTTFRTDGITNIAHADTELGSDAVNITLEVDGQEKYWDGAAWIDSNGTFAQSNDIDVANTNIDQLSITLGANVRPVIYLHSDSGASTPSLDQLVISYLFAGVEDTVTYTVVNGFLKDSSGIVPTNAKVKVTPIFTDKILRSLATKNLTITEKTIEATVLSNGYWEVKLVPSSEFTPSLKYKFVFEIEGVAAPPLERTVTTGNPEFFTLT